MVPAFQKYENHKHRSYRQKLYCLMRHRVTNDETFSIIKRSRPGVLKCVRRHECLPEIYLLLHLVELLQIYQGIIVGV